MRAWTRSRTGTPYGALGLRVFEVDHPATQAWKRERLAQAGLRPPGSLTFAPMDFEHGTLAEGLRQAGFDATCPAFFTWLGVVPYLTPEAVFATLRYIAGLPGGTAVVFDYADPPELLPPERRARHETRAARLANAGEPWRCYFTAPALAAQLRQIGLTDIEDLGPAEVAQRYLGIPPALLDTTAGGHVIRAARYRD